MNKKIIRQIKIVSLTLILAIFTPCISALAETPKPNNLTVGNSLQQTIDVVSVNSNKFLYDIEVTGVGIGEQAIVSIPVYIDSNGLNGCGFSQIKFCDEGGIVIDETLPTRKWVNVTGQYKVLFDSTNKTTFVRTYILDGDGETIKFDLTKIELNKNALPDNLFGETEIYMLPTISTSQNTSFIIYTAGGSLIVYDGGNMEDWDYLLETIYTFKSEVDYWFVSHYHSDHIGAIVEILEREELVVNNFVYSFLDKNIMDSKHPVPGLDYTVYVRLESVLASENAKGQSDKLVKNVINVGKDDEFIIDEVTITALNDVQSITNNFGNNTSIVYRVDTQAESLLLLGDAGIELGDIILKTNADKLNGISVVQSAHHGQNGVDVSFYEKVGAKVYLICAQYYLYYGTYGYNQEQVNYYTYPGITMKENREWLRDLGAVKCFVVKDGLQKIS